jgi:hypothetical protein
MKVFISYSMDDLSIVKTIASRIEHIAEIFYWDKDKTPGEKAWKSIETWINSSDVVFAVITDKTVSRGISVGQEIGIAKAKGKTIIPLVAAGIKDSELGCLSGITYERINPKQPLSNAIIERLVSKSASIETRELKDDFITLLFVVGGIVLVIWALTGKK